MNQKEEHRLPKLVVLLGPTASGKTSWSLQLARQFGGEVVSADSRQIYRDMSIGTAKAPGEWVRHGLRRVYEVEGVPHHLIDFLNPGKRFSVAEFRDRALKHIKTIYKKEKTPFVVGGTGLYISAVVDNLHIPRIPPNPKLRESLGEKSTEELIHLLRQMDPAAADMIDTKNKRRLVRALEVCIFSGEPFSKQQKKGDPLFDVLQIGIDVPREELDRRIDVRIDEMIEQGLVDEVSLLVKRRYGWNLSSMNGIGYRQLRPFIEGTGTLEDAVAQLKKDTKKYARRQLTWFRRDPRIVWCKTYEEAEERIAEFLNR